ncbi:MAG: hypothetical protein ACOY94_22045 [Bacillota bacterium]
MLFGGFGKSGKSPAFSPFIGAQAGANDLAIGPGYAAYPSANATVYRVYEYAVPVTSVASTPSALPFNKGNPGIAAFPGYGKGFGI